MSAARPKWQVAGATVRGASHLRSQLPNQDALAIDAPASGDEPVILCVSDGHGSPKCFRSEVGSRLAADVAVAVARDFVSRLGDAAPSEIKRSAETYLPREIVSTWRRKVAEHILRHPFDASEREFLGLESSAASADELARRSEFFLAYGATLVLVLVLPSCIISLQLGDGDVLCVSADGRVTAPIAADAALIANETTSICMQKAQALFRSRFQLLQGEAPALITVSTDGYSNAFASTEGFQQSGSDLLRILQRDGLDSVKASLPGWLDASSHDGSGDDVTLGFIWRPTPTHSTTESTESTHE